MQSAGFKNRLVKKIIVLISGNGSNLQAIIDAWVNHQLNIEISLVVSNKADAFGLQRAQQANIKTLVKTKLADQSRATYDQELAAIIQAHQPDFIVLAGWMRLLSNNFLQHFSQQVINIHPALPNTFPGLNAIERAFIAFQNKEIQHTGVMTHYVPDEGIDDGPIILKQMVPIYPEDSLVTLTERIHQTEHTLLIKTLQHCCQ